MEVDYFICDVFTQHRHGGNPLAVIPDATGLSGEQMQQIAREFNFSETTFVLPPQGQESCHVRIFTPSREVPFAGHPNIGTAFIMATELNMVGYGQQAQLCFSQKAGNVYLDVVREVNAPFVASLRAPEPFSLGAELPVDAVSRALSLPVDCINTHYHQPVVGSCGLPFVLVEVNDTASLSLAKVNMDGFFELERYGVMPDIHVYTKSHDEFDIRARMFAPLDGVFEDPATGSANCALVGLLAHLSAESDETYGWRIAQGVEMGRPSELLGRAKKENGQVVTTGVGGSAVLFASGTLTAD